jgi:TolB protein
MRRLILAALCLPLVAVAQEEPIIRINPSGTALYRMAVAGGGDAAKTVAADLDLTGYFQIIDPKAFPAALNSEPADTISAANWTQVGAQGVAKVVTAGNDTQCNLFGVAQSERATMRKRYSGLDARAAAHECANEIVKALTGEDSFFGTQITFAQRGGKTREIMAMDFDGQNVRTLTHMNSVSLLPSWSPRGDIAFLSYLFGAPDLWVVGSGGGRARRVTKTQDAVSGASWSPDGSKLAVSLAKNGNADIYLISPDGGVLKRLTDSPGIDTSPAFSPDGSQIAFVSNRAGNPQIYVMSASGGGVRRVTFQGNYNQTPRWCPKRDTPMLSFTGRDEKLRFDVFTIDLKSNQVARVTQNQGNNEDATWAPNCRALAYQSSRGGIWMQNPTTHIERQIYKGSAESPRWGPAPRR